MGDNNRSGIDYNNLSSPSRHFEPVPEAPRVLQEGCTLPNVQCSVVQASYATLCDARGGFDTTKSTICCAGDEVNCADKCCTTGGAVTAAPPAPTSCTLPKVQCS